MCNYSLKKGRKKQQPNERTKKSKKERPYLSQIFGYLLRPGIAAFGIAAAETYMLHVYKGRRLT